MGILYSDIKLFHFNPKLQDLSSGRISAPIHVRIKPTNSCNHSCYYCCYRNKKLPLNQLFDESDMIPRNKMMEIVADLKKMKVRAVTFSGGGEPLAYPYLDDCLPGLIKAGIKVGILTNGSLLKGRIAKIVADGAAWVRISMDAANAGSYARNRNVSLREFDSVCRNIYGFARNKRKDCRLGLNFIVTKENFRETFGYLKLMKNLGVDNVKVCECIVSADPKKSKIYLQPFYSQARQQIERAKKLLADKDFFIIDRFYEPENHSNNYQKHYTSCPFAQFMTIIAADMNVYACQDKAYTQKGKLFSVTDKSFLKGWFSEENADNLRKINPRRDCLHHCTQHNKNLMLNDYLEIDQSHVGFV